MKSLCYCTVTRTAARKITSVYDDTLAPTGVNVAQFTLLRMLERQGEIALTELGSLLELDRSTIGRNTRLMEKMGLIKLGTGDDQRETTVGLTRQGKRICEVGAPLWEAAQGRIEKKLGRKQASDLRALLSAL
jgi:DNA-binding MarR family transcriptional regulator